MSLTHSRNKVQHQLKAQWECQCNFIGNTLEANHTEIRNQTKPKTLQQPNLGRLKMARLRSAMDSCFWDFNLSTPLALDGIARAVPGDPVPLDGARASKILRAEQLSLLRTGFPLGIIPSYSPPNRKDLGSFALQSFLTQASCGIWQVSFAIHVLLIRIGVNFC